VVFCPEVYDLGAERCEEFVSGGLGHSLRGRLAGRGGACAIAEVVDLLAQFAVAVEQRSGDAGGLGDGNVVDHGALAVQAT
jgi:hypothetical protein